MIKYTDAGLVTDDAQVAVMFLGEKLDIDNELAWISHGACATFGLWNIDVDEELDAQLITIPWPTVEAAIQPVEGEAYFIVPDVGEENYSPEYHIKYVISVHPIGLYRMVLLRACPLTTGKTVGELRDLLKHCEGER